MGLEGLQPTENGFRQPEYEVTLEGRTVRVFPKSDGSYTVYVGNCSFSVIREHDSLVAENITPHENQGAWQADSLKSLAITAVEAGPNS